MTRRLAELTWPEAAAAIAGGVTTVVWPLGATEQHGPHLPLATDSLRAEALADRLAAALPAAALVAPTLAFGCSDEHTGFAGLIGVDHETLAAVIADAGCRMADWGINRLVLLSAHGGNARALALAHRRLADRRPRLAVVRLEATPALTRALTALAADDGIDAAALGLHAGDGETSEMLHLAPALVRRRRAVPGYLGPAAAILPRLRRRGVRAVSGNGILGDPSRADAGRGARYLAAEVAAYLGQLAAGGGGGGGGDRGGGGR
jgi:creatinine amidohydrolase